MHLHYAVVSHTYADSSVKTFCVSSGMEMVNV